QTEERADHHQHFDNRQRRPQVKRYAGDQLLPDRAGMPGLLVRPGIPLRQRGIHVFLVYRGQEPEALQNQGPLHEQQDRDQVQDRATPVHEHGDRFAPLVEHQTQFHGLYSAWLLVAGLGPSGDNTRRLFFHDVNDTVAARLDQGVHQDGRYGHHNTQYGGYQGTRDTAGHDLRITGTEQRDGLEHRDHTGNRTEQTKQRRYGRDDLEQRLEAFETRGLGQDGLAELQLERLDVHVLVVLVDHQHATQRVVL